MRTSTILNVGVLWPHVGQGSPSDVLSPIQPWGLYSPDGSGSGGIARSSLDGCYQLRELRVPWLTCPVPRLLLHRKCAAWTLSRSIARSGRIETGSTWSTVNDCG